MSPRDRPGQSLSSFMPPQLTPTRTGTPKTQNRTNQLERRSRKRSPRDRKYTRDKDEPPFLPKRPSRRPSLLESLKDSVSSAMYVAIGVLASALLFTRVQSDGDVGSTPSAPTPAPVLYGYKVVQDYHHDHKAYTQGLVYERRCKSPDQPDSCYDAFWESTGLYGHSTIREVEVRTGKVLRAVQLAKTEFGEGLARVGDTLIQMLWRTGKVHFWSTSDLQPAGSLLGTDSTPLKDGWGFAYDGKHLVGSDGSDKLTFMDPKTLEKKREVTVTSGDRTVPWINELEWVEGEIWANVYQTECVARIDPISGRVKGWVLFHGLRDNMRSFMRENAATYQGHSVDVLNGIAYDRHTKRLVMEVKVAPLKGEHLARAEKVAASCIPNAYQL